MWLYAGHTAKCSLALMWSPAFVWSVLMSCLTIARMLLNWCWLITFVLCWISLIPLIFEEFGGFRFVCQLNKVGERRLTQSSSAHSRHVARRPLMLGLSLCTTTYPYVIRSLWHGSELFHSCGFSRPKTWPRQRRGQQTSSFPVNCYRPAMKHILVLIKIIWNIKNTHKILLTEPFDMNSVTFFSPLCSYFIPLSNETADLLKAVSCLKQLKTCESMPEAAIKRRKKNKDLSVALTSLTSSFDII